MAKDSLKMAFIGTHGVGKTTLCYGLAARLKAADASLELVREIARRCPLPINEATGVDAQAWILHSQIAAEIAAQSRDPVVLCDRSVLDNYVYLLRAAGPQPGLEELVAHWMKTYDLLVHVPILEAPRADGVRATDPSFQRLIDERLREEIEARGLGALFLDDLPREDWLDRVEAVIHERWRPAQMPLL